MKWKLGLVSATETAEHGQEFDAFLESPETKAYHEWLLTLPEEREAERDLVEWKGLNSKHDDFL